MVTHSPASSSAPPAERSLVCPRALLGRRVPPLPIADAKLGVWGRPKVGDATRDPVPVAPLYTEPGRASREGERPPGGSGDEDRVGEVGPVYFFCVRVRENIACEREDCAFMSVSFVRLMDVPFRMRLRGH